MSMAWGLEIREPFFDYQLIEFIISLNDKNKFSKKTPKVLLVEALGDLLPHEIVYREKKGFSFPWNSWLKNELKEYCYDALTCLKKRNVFDNAYIEELWSKFQANVPTITWMHIWSLVVLEKWMEQNKISTNYYNYK
jgi:asparagine synthase (glutamine-hydrolysing)